MDPIANLIRQRELAAEVSLAVDELRTALDAEAEEAERDAYGRISDIAQALAEHVQALDEWRLSGGFDPYDPSTARPDDVGEVRWAFVRLLHDRDNGLAADRLELLDEDAAWEAYFGPLADRLEDTLAP